MSKRFDVRYAMLSGRERRLAKEINDINHENGVMVALYLAVSVMPP